MSLKYAVQMAQYIYFQIKRHTYIRMLYLKWIHAFDDNFRALNDFNATTAHFRSLNGKQKKVQIFAYIPLSSLLFKSHVKFVL